MGSHPASLVCLPSALCTDGRPSRRHALQGLTIVPVLALALALALSGRPAAAAEPGALVTILEGEARLIDGKGATAAAEGLLVTGGVLVETLPGARLMRLEWAPGRAIDLGPDTRLMLLPPSLGGDPKAPAFYLLRGWVKFTAPAAAPSPGFSMPGANVPPFTGTLVAHVSPSELWLFTESGSARVIERRRGATPLTLKGSEIYQRSGGAVGNVQARPTSAQLQEVPRAFRDTLPMRSAAVQGRTVAPRALPFPAYADLRDWLQAETGIRRELPRRFAAWAREPAFRSAVGAQLGQHAEWTLVLYPERARPSTPPATLRPASAPR
jgi:hypothetical protein